ncbi:hypothetical protein BH20ACI1_BH20ACI1_18450 [soil metagenome]
MAGDATTVTKSGTETHGIGQFFSGAAGGVVKGIEFFVFSLVSVKERKAYPVAVRQMVRSEAEKALIKKRKKKRTKKVRAKLRTRKTNRPDDQKAARIRTYTKLR